MQTIEEKFNDYYLIDLPPLPEDLSNAASATKALLPCPFCGNIRKCQEWLPRLLRQLISSVRRDKVMLSIKYEVQVETYNNISAYIDDRQAFGEFETVEDAIQKAEETKKSLPLLENHLEYDVYIIVNYEYSPDQSLVRQDESTADRE